MADGLSRAINGLVIVGLGVFLLILVLALTYASYATAKAQISTAPWNCNSISGTSCLGGAANTLTGVTSNYTTYAGGAANQFGSNIGLAIFAVIFAAIILAVVSSLREATGGGESGGFL